MAYSFAGSKAQGEWVEVCFAAECLRRGLAVAAPFGDSLPYDLIVGPRRGAGSRRVGLQRVQVKSVSVRRPPQGIYHVATMRSVATAKKAYRAGDFDLLAAFIIPRRVWYIIPAREVVGIKMISLRPDERPLRPRRLEKYREAWGLLKGS